MTVCEVCHDSASLCPKQQAFETGGILRFNNETGEVTSNSQSFGICPDSVGIHEALELNTYDTWIFLASCSDEQIINTLPEAGIPREQAVSFWTEIRPYLEGIRKMFPQK